MTEKLPEDNQDEKAEVIFMSPLADPVADELFKNEQVAGLAAKSFINAVIAPSKEKFGNIASLTVQQYVSKLFKRGCRIDVVAKSDSGKIAVFGSSALF
jgi:hypothetical protein